MAETVLLPQQGNSVESVILLQWNKQEGETVQPGDVLCEVETDKTTMEVESTAAGTVLKHLYQTGDEIPVKTPIVVVGEPGEDFAELVVEEATAEEAAAEKAAINTEPAPGRTSTDTTKPTPHRETTSPPPVSATSGTTAVSPRARMSAKRGGISPETVTGSGPGGRIIERDVLSALRTQRRTVEDVSERPATTRPDDQTVTEIKVQGVRKVIAQRMRESLASTAQLTLHSGADARMLQSMRTRFKEQGASLNVDGISVNAMVMYAVARTLPDFPELNAHFSESVIRRFSRVDLSFAVDTERGLMVPTIFGANAISLGRMSDSIKELARRCVEGNATTDDLAPGTFTCTNLGSFGIEYFTPVLNPPQVAILGINAITPRPIYVTEEVVDHVPYIGLSLTIDHQAIDGAPASRFLQELSRRIAHFDLLLAR